jgi:peptide chain release factor 2
MRDFTDDLRDVRRRLDEASEYLKVADSRDRLVELEAEISRPDLWDDAERGKQVSTDYANVKSDVDLYDELSQQLDDAELLHEMAREVDDETQEPEIEGAVTSIAKQLDVLELRSLFTGEHDDSACIVQINAKDGGVDAQDFAQMLLRMYARWAERKGFAIELNYEMEGAEAGINAAEFTLTGRYAYGLMTSERGTHRLVRISPFDGNARRQTSFASVFAWPEIDESIEIEVLDKDLRIDTYRSSGAGGQHVNVTDSAVRLTHLPSGIVVACQNERSQIRNREVGMKILKARLYELELQKRREKLDAVEAAKKDIAFGSQIRSYVLHPYRMVKDHRTKHETGNPDRVLDGDIDDFVGATLAAKARGTLGQPTSVED